MVLRRVLLIGDHRHNEFSSATDWLAENSLLSVAATPRAAVIAMQHPALQPELVLVAQSRPGQFSREEVETLHRLAPLARLAVLAGAWCEGEMRTGQPWPGVLRFYWHQSEAAVRELLTESSPLWSHPRTMTEVERLLDQPVHAAHGDHKLIAIGAESSNTYHGLAAACEVAGYASVWVSPCQKTKVQGATAGIWDENQFCESEPTESKDAIHAFTKSLGHAPIVALVNFPREIDYARLQAQGVCKIIAKPFMTTELFGVIEEQLSNAPIRCPQLAVA